MSDTLKQASARLSVLITVGAGGVGKTTIAASLALRAAVEGTGALVCTIDPAKRLANALGLGALGNVEARITEHTFAEAGLLPKAPLYAMMLDLKRSWDELIERRAPPDRRERIFNNRFYQALSTALAGSQEYIAMEKLCELRSRRDDPLIVLDTPPAAHAIDFLEAPGRVLEFLDNDAAGWLQSSAMAAGKFGLKLLNFGANTVAKSIARLSGTQTLQELADFLSSISPMNEGFRERAKETRELLEAKSTGFVLVTSPSPARIDEALALYRLLKERQLQLAAVVVNRVNPPVLPSDWEALQTVPAGRVRMALEQTLKENEHLAEQDGVGIARVRAECAPSPVLLVPRFEVDVHDLKLLYDTSRYLWGEAVVES